MKYKFFFLPLLSSTLIFTLSCKEPTEPGVDEIPGNLYPFQVGRQWIYDVKETDLNGNVIPGKTGIMISKVTRFIFHVGKNSFQMIDSMRIGDMVNIDTNYFHIDPKGNFWQFLLFERNDPNSGPGWLKFFNREIGFDKVHTVFDTTVQMPEPPYSIQIKISTSIKRKVSVTVPIGTFNEAYPGEMEMLLRIGGNSTTYKFNMWFVPNVGPVKFKESVASDFGQPVTGYRIKELRSKNF